jgi:hypothetical protein
VKSGVTFFLFYITIPMDVLMLRPVISIQMQL